MLPQLASRYGKPYINQSRADSTTYFQLYTDFIFADFLLSCTPFVSEVVFQ